MSKITTKRGDDGKSDLLQGGRVPKHHPVFDLVGTIDELSAHLTLARSLGLADATAQITKTVQQTLIQLMGEIITPPTLRKIVITAQNCSYLEEQIATLESRGHGEGWLQPDQHPSLAALDVARTVCRRSERLYSLLREQRWTDNMQALIFLNRLSDWLWLAANQESEI